MKRKWTRFFTLALACGMLMLNACTTIPVEKSVVKKSSMSEAQEKNFQSGKQLYLGKQYEQAAKILLPLAQQGHTDAQYTVGYMYRYGYGLPQNENESTRWISMAAASGHDKAKKALLLISTMQQQNNPPP